MKKKKKKGKTIYGTCFTKMQHEKIGFSVMFFKKNVDFEQILQTENRECTVF